jgi:hypothetical protein
MGAIASAGPLVGLGSVAAAFAGLAIAVGTQAQSALSSVRVEEM